MLYCCSKFFSTKKKYLLDTFEHHNRVLEYGFCPVCKVLEAKLTQIDKKGVKNELKPKKRQAKQFVENYLKEPYYEQVYMDIKTGSKQNMFWLYNAGGTIKDFNDEIKGKCITDIRHSGG